MQRTQFLFTVHCIQPHISAYANDRQKACLIESSLRDCVCVCVCALVFRCNFLSYFMDLVLLNLTRIINDASSFSVFLSMHISWIFPINMVFVFFSLFTLNPLFNKTFTHAQKEQKEKIRRCKQPFYTTEITINSIPKN